MYSNMDQVLCVCVCACLTGQILQQCILGQGNPVHLSLQQHVRMKAVDDGIMPGATLYLLHTHARTYAPCDIHPIFGCITKHAITNVLAYFSVFLVSHTLSMVQCELLTF